MRKDAEMSAGILKLAVRVSKAAAYWYPKNGVIRNNWLKTPNTINTIYSIHSNRITTTQYNYLQQMRIYLQIYTITTEHLTA